PPQPAPSRLLLAPPCLRPPQPPNPPTSSQHTQLQLSFHDFSDLSTKQVCVFCFFPVVVVHLFTQHHYNHNSNKMILNGP
ncbi:unnamed protein product, partial [Linum tenue]